MSTQQPLFQRTVDAMVDIGHFGGMLDAKDAIGAGPVALIADPALNVNNPNNPNHTAGTTFFGQFLDHDMTFDANSSLAVVTDPAQSPNTRTPALDLDSVYGGGPTATPQFYSSTDRAKLRIESGGRFEDVPRGGNNVAIIADPRNDENVVISGLQAAFIGILPWIPRPSGRGGNGTPAEQCGDSRSAVGADRRPAAWHREDCRKVC